jgi:hypothetical protein
MNKKRAKNNFWSLKGNKLEILKNIVAAKRSRIGDSDE